MEETISLKELYDTLKKRIVLILSITIAAALISGVVSYFVLTPVYQSSTQILVNQAKDNQEITKNDLDGNLQLINTYNVIIKSPAILDIVKEELNLSVSTSALNEKISVQSEQNSQVVKITVEDESAEQAALIANKTAEVFRSEIPDIMNIDNVSILASAEITENQSPIKPNPLLNIAIAFVVGLMAGVGLAFLLEYMDNTVKNEEDIEKAVGLPVLGLVANIEEGNEKGKDNQKNPKTRRSNVGSKTEQA
ncbi:capsular biosynthesis protein [Cytobacillus kochii]|uniref:YveK family protein n=1 Tax=Cytobacillus kochii TaxID=859143 RepID=UPI001CD7169D|nr:Wzz/FepE/Etk N-terminal domain-containing protein [Cytobacillus kochii]MCA1026272.1 capsular biosynthesis protein [Cytobacillus kochii]MDM5209496.1 Wzz/FepE/Etk N-terminal domain-containing protein [Cytobacillus kochii]